MEEIPYGRELTGRLGNLSSLEKQREQDARDFDGSINYVLDWIEANQMSFEGKIHKPPMISVNMREKGLAAQVEACTTVQQRKVRYRISGGCTVF